MGVSADGTSPMTAAALIGGCALVNHPSAIDVCSVAIFVAVAGDAAGFRRALMPVIAAVIAPGWGPKVCVVRDRGR